MAPVNTKAAPAAAAKKDVKVAAKVAKKDVKGASKVVKKSVKKVTKSRKPSKKQLLEAKRKLQFAQRRAHRLKLKLESKGIKIRRSNKEKSPAELKKEIRVIKRQGGITKYVRQMRAFDKKRAAANKEACIAKQEKMKSKTHKQQEFKVERMRPFFYTQLPSRSAKPKGHVKRGKRIMRLRKSLTPGTVCISVAGRYQGRKVVFLKQLDKSGLCLVTGPHKLTRIPLRRMHQNYLIATSIKLELPKKFEIPVHVDDLFFNSLKKKSTTKRKNPLKADDGLFKAKKVTKKRVPASRVRVQKYVDKAVMTAIRRHEETGTLIGYMKRQFGLLGKRYPHAINF